MLLCVEIFLTTILVIYFIKKVSLLDYYFKFFLCYTWISISSFLVLPYLVFKRRDVQNFLILAAVMKYTSKLTDLRYEIRGKEHLSKDHSCVMVANHQSGLDLIGMILIWPFAGRMTPVVKYEISYAGTFGIACWFCKLIPIKRKAGRKAGEALKETMLSLKAEKTKLWIYSEGTRRNTGEIHQFKKGAFHAAIHAQVPIVPVVYSSYKHFLKSKTERTFNKGNIIITALPEISTIGLSINDVDDLLARTREAMIDTYNKTTKEVEEINLKQ